MIEKLVCPPGYADPAGIPWERGPALGLTAIPDPRGGWCVTFTIGDEPVQAWSPFEPQFGADSVDLVLLPPGGAFVREDFEGFDLADVGKVNR